MAQPDYPKITRSLNSLAQSLNSLGEELPRLENLPVFNMRQHLEEMEGRLNMQMQAMENRLNRQTQEMEGRLNEQAQAMEGRLNRQAQEMEDRLNGRMQEMEGRLNDRIDQLEVFIGLNQRIAHARALNLVASTDDSRLYPVPLPNGEMPENFPRTFRDIGRLEEPALSNLIQQYQLAGADNIPHLLEDRRVMFADHIGSRYLK